VPKNLVRCIALLMGLQYGNQRPVEGELCSILIVVVVTGCKSCWTLRPAAESRSSAELTVTQRYKMTQGGRLYKCGLAHTFFCSFVLTDQMHSLAQAIDPLPVCTPPSGRESGASHLVLPACKALSPTCCSYTLY
jgi:hypothetical protein